jgi:hypothetical protein
MEKIKLLNGQEFNVIPMGVIDNPSTKRRSFKITSELASTDIKDVFSNLENISTIDYVLQDGTLIKSYCDCVSLKGLSVEFGAQVDENITADVYTVELSIDAVERAMQVTKEKISTMENHVDSAVAELTIMIATMFTLIPQGE